MADLTPLTHMSLREGKGPHDWPIVRTYIQYGWRSKSFPGLIDTGASYLFVPMPFAEELGMDRAQAVPVQASVGRQRRRSLPST